jgi:hypothetical protein
MYVLCTLKICKTRALPDMLKKGNALEPDQDFNAVSVLKRSDPEHC